MTDAKEINIDIHPKEAICADCNYVYWREAGCGECRLINEGR